MTIDEAVRATERAIMAAPRHPTQVILPEDMEAELTRGNITYCAGLRIIGYHGTEVVVGGNDLTVPFELSVFPYKTRAWCTHESAQRLTGNAIDGTTITVTSNNSDDRDVPAGFPLYRVCQLETCRTPPRVPAGRALSANEVRAVLLETIQNHVPSMFEPPPNTVPGELYGSFDPLGGSLGRGADWTTTQISNPAEVSAYGNEVLGRRDPTIYEMFHDGADSEAWASVTAAHARQEEEIRQIREFRRRVDEAERYNPPSPQMAAQQAERTLVEMYGEQVTRDAYEAALSFLTRRASENLGIQVPQTGSATLPAPESTRAAQASAAPSAEAPAPADQTPPPADPSGPQQE